MGELVQPMTVSYKYGENEILMINQVHSGPDTPPLTITMPEIQDVTVRGQPWRMAARGEALAGVGRKWRQSSPSSSKTREVWKKP